MNRNASMVLLGVLIGVCGTLLYQSYFFPYVPLPSNSYGRFIGQLSPTWLNNGREMKLNSDFLYIDPFSKAWIAPTGSVIDGASIPRPLWSIIGGPFEGQYRNASVIHDAACIEKTQPSDAVHLMFYFACRCGGTSEAKAKAMYYAVSHFGPKWQIAPETRIIDGVPVPVNKGIPVLQVAEMTQDQAKRIAKFFEENNPALSAIPSLEIAPP